MLNSDCWYKDVCVRDSDVCEPRACIRYLEMRCLMDNSNIPKNRQRPVELYAPDCDFDAYVHLADIKRDIFNFVQTGQNLYITSKLTGNGKTSWAIKLLMKYFDCVWAGNGFRPRGVFVHVPTFLLKCKDFNNKDAEFDALRQAIQYVDLVVWDDIASSGISAYDYSQLLMHIDGRVSNGLSNIFTGNITDRDMMQKALGGKLTSRIWSNDTTIITFTGGDKR